MMRRTTNRCGTTRRGGFALLTVILVLAALLLLLTPFLVSARHTDQGSAQLYDRASTDVALETARVHVRAELERSHFALDETAYSDSLDEVTVDNRFPEGFLDANDAQGVMWDVEVTDIAGAIDLSSCPPQVISNLMGATTRFTRPIEPDDDTLPVASTAGLPASGVIVAGGEYIHYGAIEGGELVDLTRGLGARLGENDEPLPGPRPPSKHGVGAPVLDQRAHAPARWRLDNAAGDVRLFTSPEQLAGLDALVLAKGGMGSDVLDVLRRTTSVHARVGAGSMWQRPVRLTVGVERGVDDNLRVDSSRYVNEGSTIRITDGDVSEVHLVRRVSRSGTIYLEDAVRYDYDAYTAVVEALVRRPVNLNTAPPHVLEAVLENLQIRGRNSRITGSEARELAIVIAAMRPFGDLEDFVRWIVLPAAGIETLPADAPTKPDALAGDRALIDVYDAIALYANALNANDSILSFSTVPFRLTTRDVYRTDLRAMVNAPSGVARHSEVREEVERIVPQEELLHLWHTQRDFDDALRGRRAAAWWATGPEATSQYDGAYAPPSRLWPALGTYQGQVYVPGMTGDPPATGEEAPQVEHTFASDDALEHWAQLWPARLDETDERQGRVLHFDREVRELEGRSLPDQPITRDPQDGQVRWSGGQGLMRQLGFSLWVQPRSHADGRLLDVGGASTDTDRVSLAFEQGELVLRVIAGGGDHGGTTEEDWTELRYPLAQGEGPGLPIDVWSHIAVDVRGSAPSQSTLLVNGTAHGVETPGLTTLSGAVSDADSFLPLEDTAGFPQRGTARVGNEIVEYVLSTGGLDCRFRTTGPDAGFGGRNARARWTGVETTVPANLPFVDLSHPAGTTVEVYGYSAPLASDAPSGSARLPGPLGSFRVAAVAGVEGGSQTNGDPIEISFTPLGGGPSFDLPIGFGMLGSGSAVTGLRLAPASFPDRQASEAQVMEAFSPNGGYAAIVQQSFTNDTSDGSRLGGVEIVRYTGWNGDVLQIAERGVATPNLGSSAVHGGSRSFVTEWTWTDPATQRVFQDDLSLRTFVFPISVPAPGTSAVQGFLQGGNGQARFAQLTHRNAAERTEWIAYDWFDQSGGFLVRDAWEGVLGEAYLSIVGGRGLEIDTENPPGPPPGGGGGALLDGGADAPPAAMHAPAASPAQAEGGDLDTQSGDAAASRDGDTADLPTIGQENGLVPPEEATLDPVDPEDGKTEAGPEATIAGPQSGGGAYWEPTLGAPDDDGLPITRAVRASLQHRGVMGTASGSHEAGTSIVPVFQIQFEGGGYGHASGMPGRYDQAFVFGSTFDHLGWPVEVHRAHAPNPEVPAYSWQQQNEATPIADASENSSQANDFFLQDLGVYYVALVEPQPEPIPAGAGPTTGAGSRALDTRGLARLAKYPTGERPRIVANVAIGGGFQPGTGVVPEVIVDEVLFSDTDFGTNILPGDPDTTQGAQLVVERPSGAQDLRLELEPNRLRLPYRDQATGGTQVLGPLPSDAGLLQVGRELIVYDDVDASNGVLTIAPGGRGVLGTEPQPHGTGEGVTFLSQATVTTLSGGVSAEDAFLPFEDTQGFPNEGTVLVGDELIHYTRLRGGGIEMPRRSQEPGARDESGSGLFRGRYGTTPSGHAAGTPVFHFPFRYWDRWSERADAPELAYFEFELEEPAAWWTGMFFDDERAAVPGAEIHVLQRSDPSVSWDADPDATEGLDLFRVGIEDGRELPLGFQSDRVQWRVFVDYPAGAFDPITANSHVWRTTPRLRRLGAFYYAPSLTLRSVER